MLRLLLGFALVPAIIGLGYALVGGASEAKGATTVLSLDSGIFAFLAGFCGFSLVYVFFPISPRAYIWAHELTHALFARLHGARVRDLSVEEDCGSIVLSKKHLLTILSPYFFPLYTVGVILVLLLLSFFVPHTHLRIPGLALLGVSWGFHACFTINSMMQHQTDLEYSGYIFSYVFVTLLNLIVLAIGLLVTTSYPVLDFLLLWRDHSAQAYTKLWATVFAYYNRIWGLF